MRIISALLPVILFLILLLVLDSFKLVRKSLLMWAIISGVVCAGSAYLLNTELMVLLNLDLKKLYTFTSPLIEETLKMIPVLIFLRKHRIGFLIDGAIYGFAIGTGFALVENIYFLFQLPDTSIWLWIARGFGTAVMHGGTTSILAMIFTLTIERKKFTGMYYFAGWILAVGIHICFNLFLMPPLQEAILIITVISVVEICVFKASELSLRNWLEMEFDSEMKLINMIHRGNFASTKPGVYLMSLKKHFSSVVIFDMLAYISLYLELSIRAKAQLMLHETGLPPNKDPEIAGKLQELQTLENNIGRTGKFAISPILRMSRKDLWKWSLLL